MTWQDYTSTERLAVVAAGLEAGLTQKEIGEKHSTSANAVTGFISRNAEALGVIRADPEARPGTGNSNKAVKGVAVGWTEAVLTEKWKKRASVVTKITARPGRPSKLTDLDKQYVTRLYKDGTKIAVIAAELDVSEKTVKNEIGNQIHAGKLRTRRPNIGGVLFRLQLSLDDERKVYAGAKRRGSSKADYVRYLIRRDNP